MAQIFYGMDETMQKLGLTESGVLELVRTNQLRLYQDGPVQRFKAAQVDRRANGEPDPTLEQLARSSAS